ncbi:MAG: ABC transporter ATP-binding protein [Halobacteriales archaeon]|nr:ABC transporter ATP-binding protein [Halobacteriales archaeon]
MTEPRPEPEDAALGTVGLTRTFGAVVAVDDVDLAVPAGELRAIIGPNGAGKTTLFNVITSRLPPSAGSVYLEGRDVTGLAEERRPHLGLARSFQSNELFNDLTALENVRIVAQTAESGPFSLDLFRSGRTVAVERAHELLERVDLAAKHDAEASNLSHGDQRRLGLAMALATDPSVLLLDEPTSGMGPGETEETAALIESVQRDLGLTVLLIEHDMDIVLSISDRITVLNQGVVLATGSPEAIQDNEAVQEAYLGGMREAL